MSQPQKKKTVEEATQGCQFCANRVPQTVTWQCGWCKRTRTYILLVEEEEAETTLAIPIDLPKQSGVVVHD